MCPGARCSKTLPYSVLNCPQVSEVRPLHEKLSHSLRSTGGCHRQVSVWRLIFMPPNDAPGTNSVVSNPSPASTESLDVCKQDKPFLTETGNVNQIWQHSVLISIWQLDSCCSVWRSKLRKRQPKSRWSEGLKLGEFLITTEICCPKLNTTLISPFFIISSFFPPFLPLWGICDGWLLTHCTLFWWQHCPLPFPRHCSLVRELLSGFCYTDAFCMLTEVSYLKTLAHP